MCRGKGYTGSPSDQTENPNLRQVSEVPDGVLDRAGKIATIAAGPVSGVAREGLLYVSLTADVVDWSQTGDFVKFGRNYVIDKMSFGWGDTLGGLGKAFSGALSELQKNIWERMDGITGTSPGFKLPRCTQCLSDFGNSKGN
jgi:hypothetical protein